MKNTPSIDAELLLENATWIRGLARRLVADDAAAEDLVQETWVAALRGPRPAEGNLRGWLATVLRNRARNFHRARGRRSEHERAAARSEVAPDSESTLERAELHRLVVEQVLALREPLREALVLRYLDGLSPAEIARRLDVPGGTVRWRLSTGLAELREALDRAHGGDRERWKHALVPLAGLRRSGGASVALGGAWLAAGAVGALAVALGLVWRSWAAREAPPAASTMEVARAEAPGGGGPEGGPSAPGGSTTPRVAAGSEEADAALSDGVPVLFRLVDRETNRPIPDFEIEVRAPAATAAAEPGPLVADPRVGAAPRARGESGRTDANGVFRGAVPFAPGLLRVTPLEIVAGQRHGRARFDGDPWRVERRPGLLPDLEHEHVPGAGIVDLPLASLVTFEAAVALPPEVAVEDWFTGLVDGEARRPAVNTSLPLVAQPDGIVRARHTRYSVRGEVRRPAVFDADGHWAWLGEGPEAAVGVLERRGRLEVELEGPGIPGARVRVQVLDSEGHVLVDVERTAPANAPPVVLRWLPVGEVTLVVDAERHEPLEETLSVRAGTRTLALRPMPMHKDASGSVQVHVRTTSGEPADALTVHVRRQEWRRDGRETVAPLAFEGGSATALVEDLAAVEVDVWIEGGDELIVAPLFWSGVADGRRVEFVVTDDLPRRDFEFRVPGRKEFFVGILSFEHRGGVGGWARGTGGRAVVEDCVAVPGLQAYLAAEGCRSRVVPLEGRGPGPIEVNLESGVAVQVLAKRRGELRAPYDRVWEPLAGAEVVADGRPVGSTGADGCCTVELAVAPAELLVRYEGQSVRAEEFLLDGRAGYVIARFDW